MNTARQISMSFICELADKEKLAVFKAIKAKLIATDSLTVENLRLALDSRVCDVR